MYGLVTETENRNAAGDRAENRFISEKLSEVADLLSGQGADPFRIRAFRDAAQFVAEMPDSLRDVFEVRGKRGLVLMPTVGESIAGAIVELLQTGELGMIRRLRGEVDPEKVLQTVPMIGSGLARKIHEELGIETLEGLEAAAYDGRLAMLGGFGHRRVQSIRHSLSEMLARQRIVHPKNELPAPPINAILDVDREYRRRDAQSDLPRIAPRRFNPSGRAWLSILHTKRGQWRFTALFSNTPNAHRLNRTKDWVVVYFEKNGTAERQCTVVTETRGPFKGKRVVRGHEPHHPAEQNRSKGSDT